MTRDKDRKRIIRNRMKKTGESYTTARAHVISKSNVKQTSARIVDHAALAGMSDDKVSAKTGRTWQEWTRVLDLEDVAGMPHRDIAALVHGKYRVQDWWAQTVTVGYERIKGLRERGQRRGGAYEASKSRTFNVPVRALFDAWANAATRRHWLNGGGIVVRTASAPRSMRLQWPDGTLVAVGFYAKGNAKSSVAVQHMKLPDKASSENAKKYWTDRFDALASLLATT
jgi:hypothetical protein